MMTEYNSPTAQDSTSTTTMKPEKSLWEKVKSNPFDFSAWESLVASTESNLARVVAESPRNIISGSKVGPSGCARTLPEPVQKAIDEYNGVYTAFLGRFPYCFGYWKKYAECILAHMGDELSRDVYERSVTAFPNSLDLWMQYCTATVKTVKITGDVRDLFKRASLFLRNDPNAFAFFDLYLQWEEEKAMEENSYSRVLALLDLLLTLPLYHAQRYLDRYHQIATVRPTAELIGYQEYMELRKRFSHISPNTPLRKPEMMVEDEIDVPIKEHILGERTRVATEAAAKLEKSYKYEEAIKRSYFHVKPLEEGQLANWRAFLDEEQSLATEDDYSRLMDIYERCLVPCAMYEEFWLRYIAFLQEKGLTEKVEDAFKRALHTFVPSSRSDLFLAYCHYKEEAGEIDTVRELYAHHVKEHPNQVKVLIHQDNFEARNGSSQHSSVLEDSLASDLTSSQTKAIVYIQLAKKAMLRGGKGEEDARQWYEQAYDRFDREKSSIPSILIFSFLQFEQCLLMQPSLEARCKSVVAKTFANPLVSVSVKKQLFGKAYSFLSDLGAVPLKWLKEWKVEVDGELVALAMEEKSRFKVNGKRPLAASSEQEGQPPETSKRQLLQ